MRPIRGRDQRLRTTPREGKKTMSLDSRRTVTTWSKRGAAACLLLAFASVALVGAGCGGSAGTPSAAARPTAAPVHRTITPTSRAEMARFTGDAGLAFGIFHRYVYTLRGETLKTRGQRTRAFGKASAAASAAAREVVLAKKNAVDSTRLRKLFGPLAGLQPMLRSIAKNLGRGHLDAAGVMSANAAIAYIEQAGSVGGVKIVERAPATIHG